MKQYGLIGLDVSYSYSKIIHEYIAKIKNIDLEYHLISTGDLGAIDFNQYAGLNITNPYKSEILKYVKHQSAEVKQMANANTIIGTNQAHNTDVLGLKYALAALVGDLSQIKRVLVLGNSNTSKMIKYLFENQEVIIVSRNPSAEQIAYDQISEFYGDIIINTTPLTMKDLSLSPVNQQQLKNFKYAYDLNYNPSHNLFLKQASELNISNDNGLLMLIMQAIYAFEIWNELSLSNQEIEQVIKFVKQIVWPRHAIIGMPYSGKTTLGSKYAAQGYRVVDLDQVIEQNYGPIDQIIREAGIASFRQIENKTLQEVTEQEYDVLICGGGIVENMDNYQLLSEHQVLYLEKDFKTLQKQMQQAQNNNEQIRPLSSDVESLQMRLENREIKYKIWAKNCIIQ